MPSGHYSDLWGTMKGLFHLNGPTGPMVKNPPTNPERLQSRLGDDSVFVPHEAKSISEVIGHNLSGSPIVSQLATFLDIISKAGNVVSYFHGNNNPVGATSQYEFVMCHTDGSQHNAGDLFVYIGTTYYKIPPLALVSHITTKGASGGQINLSANSLYARESGTWVYKGGASMGFGMQTVKRTVTSTSNTTFSFPAGSVIVKIIIEVTDAFDAGSTITTSRGTQSLTLATDCDATQLGTYVVEVPFTIESTGTATITVSGTGGEATVYFIFDPDPLS